MTAAWFLWYGLHLGLCREEALSVPLSELLDLIAVEQIKSEGARQKLTQEEEQDEFMRLLDRR